MIEIKVTSKVIKSETITYAVDEQNIFEEVNNIEQLFKNNSLINNGIYNTSFPHLRRINVSSRYIDEHGNSLPNNNHYIYDIDIYHPKSNTNYKLVKDKTFDETVKALPVIKEAIQKLKVDRIKTTITEIEKEIELLF